MKKAKYLVALVCTLAFQLSNADNSTTKSENTQSYSETTLKLNAPNNTSRPNAPSRYYIECFYGDSLVCFTFPDGVEYMTVSIFNEVEEFTWIIFADSPWIEISGLSGEYEIECTTDDGRVFSGTIEW